MSADTRCFICSGDASTVRERTEFRIGNRSASVEVDSLRCRECGESFYTPAQAEAAQRAAADELRRQDGLLTPGEIRAIRTKYGLTQLQLERLLGVGAKTVVRWERGTVFQNRSTDMLLRVLREVPEAFNFLAQANGLVAEAACTPSVVRYAPVETLARATSKARVLSFPSETQMKRVQIAEEFEVPEIPQEALK